MYTNSEKKAQLCDVADYYEHVEKDFKFLWFQNDVRHLHCGYQDETTRTHQDEIVNMNKVLARKAKISADSVVLDAGCGKGNSIIWMAKNLQAKAVGISICSKEVDCAKENIEKQDLKHISVSEQDYCQTNFPDASFDVVWALESLCHAENKELFYEEAFRVLKPGGRLIVAEFIRVKRHLEPELEELMGLWLNSWAIPDLDTANEHKANLEKLGFKNISLEDHTKHVLPSIIELSSFAKKVMPVESVLSEIGVVNKKQHNNIKGAIKQQKALEQNLWYYGIISAEKK